MADISHKLQQQVRAAGWSGGITAAPTIPDQQQAGVLPRWGHASLGACNPGACSSGQGGAAQHTDRSAFASSNLVAVCFPSWPLQKSLATSNIINKMRASNLEANRQRGGRQTQLLDNPVQLQANGR